jgi:hypothetical protein
MFSMQEGIAYHPGLMQRFIPYTAVINLSISFRPCKTELNNRKSSCAFASKMSDEYQIVIPASFIALFVEPGRARPSATKEHIYARYDFCEDLASMLTEPAANKLWELGITEADVLERMLQGLTSTDVGVNAAEAQWVIHRLAELMNWSESDWPRSTNP